MPTLSVVKGIKVYINWDDHLPPHFHAMFAGQDVSIDLETLEQRGIFLSASCGSFWDGQNVIKTSFLITGI